MRTWVLPALLGITLVGIKGGADDVIPDLAQVQGIQMYDGPESGQALLKKNGFVVVQRFYHRIFSPYWDKSIPHYVTIDSVLNTYHVIFEELLKELETQLAAEVTTLTTSMRNHFKDAAAPDEVLAKMYFEVAECLLTENDGSGPVGAELRLIESATEVAPSPVFGYAIDYSQFKPRGFYTATPLLRRHFQAMTWYGNVTFRLADQTETSAAMLIAKALSEDAEAIGRWEKLDAVYHYLLGPCDDSSPRDYIEAGPDGLDDLPDPRINSMALFADEMENWFQHTKGMRFLGKRHIPDSELFMNITDPSVPQRGFPTGLEVLVAKMNLAIRGIDAQIANGDTFHNDRHPDLKADFILANPPFNISDWGGERLRGDKRWQHGVPPAGNANFAWVQHMVHHLAPAGVAGFVLANGSMSSNTSGEGEIRKNLIEADLVDCMIALPGQLFYSTQIPACLWFLARTKRGLSQAQGDRRSHGDGTVPALCARDRRGHILFIDARKLGSMVDRTHRELTPDDIARIAGTYHAWRGEKGAGKYADTPGFCKSAALDEVSKHGHVLTPGRYVGAEAQEDDGEPFAEKMRRLTAQLREQQTEAAKLDKAIAQNLKELGYGG